VNFLRTHTLPVTGAFQPLMALVSRMAGPGLLFLLMVLAYWRILLTDQYSWMNGSDLTSQVLPWLQFQAGEWHAGRLPLWSPYEWAGQNLLGQGQPGVLSPLNWILFASPLRRGWLREGVLHWWFFLLHFVAALNLYWLARFLGAGRIPAVLGGLCFGLFGFLGSNDWPQMINGVVWAPLVLLFLFRSAKSVLPLRDAGWAGFFLGLCWLSGHHQLPIFVSLSALAAAVALRLYPAALSFAIAGLIAAPQLLPGLAYGKLAVRWVGMEHPVGWQEKVSYYVHDQYASPPSSLLSLLLPGAETHTSLFLGMTALSLAVWALRTQWARVEIRILFSIGLGTLLYSMGRSGGLEPLFYSLVPMVEKARSPSMAAAMFTLSFSALAAIGMEALRLKHTPLLMERMHWAFAGTVIGLFSVAKLLPGNQSQLEQRWLAVAFVSLLAGMAFRAVRSGAISQRSLSMLLLCAVLIESANMTYYNMASRHDKNAPQLLEPMSKQMDVREFLATRPAPVRITVDDKEIPFNFGDWHGIEVMGGYLASLTKTHADADWFTPRALQLAGVGYHVGPTARIEGSALLFTGSGGVNVWAYPRTPFPRAWLANASMGYRDTSEFGMLVETETLDLRQVVLSQDKISGLGSCANGEAIVLRHDPGRVVIRSKSACRSILVLADSDDPGWSVTVDGAGAEKLNVFHAFRAVVAPEGEHTVEWTYSPEGFRPGLAAAAFGFILLAGSQFKWRTQAIR